MINKINYALSKKIKEKIKLPIYVNKVEQGLKLPCIFIFNIESIGNSYGGVMFSITHTIDIIYKTDDETEHELTNNIFDELRKVLNSITIDEKVYIINEEGTSINGDERHFIFKITVPSLETNTISNDPFYKVVIDEVKKLSGLETFYLNGILNKENLKDSFFILRPIEEELEQASVIGNYRIIRNFEIILFENLEARDSYGWLSSLAKKIWKIALRNETEKTINRVVSCKIIPDYKYTDDDEFGIIATYKLNITMREE